MTNLIWVLATAALVRRPIALRVVRRRHDRGELPCALSRNFDEADKCRGVAHRLYTMTDSVAHWYKTGPEYIRSNLGRRKMYAWMD